MKEIKISVLCVVLLLVAIVISMSITGCSSEADKVSYNLSQEADNFNVVRQLTVINCIEGDVIFQMTGKLSITKDNSDNQLEIVVEKEDGTYHKHFVGLSDNVTYLVEDLGTNNVDRYNYTLNYNPKMWLPIGFDSID